MLKHGAAALLSLGLLASCSEREVILSGERFDVRTPLSASVPTEGEAQPIAPEVANRSVPISLPAPVALADWTHRGSNPRHLSPHSTLSAQPARIWSASIGEGNSRRYRIVTTPVVAGGRVFTLDARNGLTATSTGGGTLWRVDLTLPSDRGGEAAGGGLAYGDGRLYVTTAYGELIAIDPASGGVVWRQRFDAPVTGAPTVDNGIVYVAARDSSGWAVDATDGRLRWEIPGIPATAGVAGAAGPAVADRLVMFPFPSGQLLAALRVGGAEIWQASVAGNRLGTGRSGLFEITGDPVVAGSVTYVANALGRVAAIDTATGQRIWDAVEGATSTLAVAGGSVFLVNDRATLVRLDAATGEVIWAAEMPFFRNETIRRRKAVTAHYGPVLAGGRLVVASSDGVLRLFSPTDGSLQVEVSLPGGAASAPVVAGGVLYVVGADGQLHAFR